jgi:hypothetical protein
MESIRLSATDTSITPASIRRAFLLLGVITGMLLGWPLLSGDSQGQVNLLAVLVLLALLPLVTLLFSLGALMRRKDHGMRLLWQWLPLPASWRQRLRALRVGGDSFWWLFYAGQWLAVGFSLGNLTAFGLLLLFTDLHFIWRSTLLQTGDLLPWLRAIASPWRWWDAAQPSLEWLAQSRDDRLGGGNRGLDDWWRFLLAAQLCYALLPRLALAAWASRHLERRRTRSAATPARPQSGPADPLPPLLQSPPADAEWLDAAWLPPAIAGQLPQAATPLEREPPADRPLVIVVRAWEPPLAELGDRLRGRHGLLLPLDWAQDHLREPRPTQLDEWRRFAATLDGWGILQWSPPDD